MTCFSQLPLTCLIIFFCHVPACIVSYHPDIIEQSKRKERKQTTKHPKPILGNGEQVFIAIKIYIF